MPTTKAYAAFDSKSPLRPFEVNRREPRPQDVAIDILYCGICHTDLHQVHNDWQRTRYPIVPGHEIVGRVAQVGSAVTRLKPGQLVGVGCMVDSCRQCSPCGRGLEQHCEQGMTPTYNGVERGTETTTYGGYSSQIVVDQHFVVTVPEQGSLEAVAPLLCAGITTYSPLRHWKIGPGAKVGIVGLGGLGHMGVKIAAAMGAEVTLFSTSAKKAEDARRLGAHELVVSTDAQAMAKQRGRLDFILDTVSATHELAPLLMALRLDGTMVLVGAPDRPHALPVWSLLFGRRSIAGSSIGGIPETQEMLEFCAKHKVVSDVEVVPVQKVNEAYERLARSDVRYRFVIDNSSLT